MGSPLGPHRRLIKAAARFTEMVAHGQRGDLADEHGEPRLAGVGGRQIDLA
jgi:hypothetical protein